MPRPLLSQSVNNYAANFVAGSSQFLNISDNTTLSMGTGVRMAFWGWFILTNLPSKSGTTMNLLAKWNTSGNQREYRLIVTTADQLRFDVSADGIASTTVTRTGALSLTTPYFVVCWYDGTNINISLNNGSTTSAAFSADIFNGTAQFRLGAQQGGEFLSGRMQSWGIAKSTSITDLLPESDRTLIYNSGKTLKYADVSGKLSVTPISWWNLDETINASTRDDSVGSNTLNSNANVTAAEGNVATVRQPIRDFGTCVAFPGVTSNWIRFPDASQTGLDLQATDFTILSWVNHTGLVNTANNAAAIVAKDGRNDGSRGYRFSITGAHLLTFTITETGNTADYKTVTSNVQVPAHGWHRVAVVFKQSTSIELYLDGVLIGSSTTSIPAQPFNNNRDFEVATSNTADLFQGRMDNLQVFTRAFAASEIVTDYLGLSDSTTNCILYWKFNEGSGTAITDSSGTQVNATLVGSSWSSDVFIKPRSSASNRAPIGAYSSVILADSPFAYYRLGESSGNVADLSGNGLTGVASGSTFTYGQTGGLPAENNTSINGNGSTALFASANQFNLNGSTTGSVEAWVKFATLPTGGTIYEFTGISSLSFTNGIGLFIDASGIFGQIRTGSGDNLPGYAISNLNAGVWYHVVLTYSSGVGAKLYINGRLVATANTVNGAIIHQLNTPIYLFRAASAGRNLNGNLQEVVYYTTALTQAQITRHYQAGSSARRISVDPVIEDTFTRDNSSNSLGSTENPLLAWDAILNTWGISSNKGAPINATESMAIVDCNLSDCMIEAELTRASSNIGLLFRTSSLSSYLVLRSSGSSLIIFKNNGGSTSTIFTVAHSVIGSWSAAQTKRLGIRMMGSTIEVYYEGGIVGVVSDSFNQTVTKHGLYSNGSSSNRFDNFKIY